LLFTPARIRLHAILSHLKLKFVGGADD